MPIHPIEQRKEGRKEGRKKGRVRFLAVEEILERKALSDSVLYSAIAKLEVDCQALFVLIFLVWIGAACRALY